MNGNRRPKTNQRLDYSGVTDAKITGVMSHIDRRLQTLEEVTAGRNFFLSDGFTGIIAAAGLIPFAQARLTSNGNPIVGAFVPAPYKELVTAAGVPAIGGVSSLEVNNGVATTSQVDAVLAVYRNNSKAFTLDLGAKFNSTNDTGRALKLSGIVPLFFDPLPGTGDVQYQVKIDSLALSSQIAFNALQYLLFQW